MSTTARTMHERAGALGHSLPALFVAGFIAVLVFQMGMITILQLAGMSPAPFPMQPTKPFGVPQIWSFAFWGGVWGIAFGFAEKYFPKGPSYWAAAILFGALAPTLVLWFIVFPLKGLPLAAGWNATRMIVHLLNHQRGGSAPHCC
jgi:hypothetical protein